MSETIDAHQSATSVAKNSGLMDLLKSRIQSSSDSGNGTLMSEPTFKVPRVPLNLQSKQKLKINSERVADAFSQYENVLEHTFNMYEDNESALLGLIKSLLYTCTEYPRSLLETTLAGSVTSCNDMTMERSTISSNSNYRSTVQINENMKTQVQPYVRLHNYNDPHYMSSITDMTLERSTMSSNMNYRSNFQSNGNILRNRPEPYVRTNNHNGLQPTTSITGGMERSDASSTSNFRRLLQPNKRIAETPLQQHGNSLNTNGPKSTSSFMSLRKGIDGSRMNDDRCSRNACSGEKITHRLLSNSSESENDGGYLNVDSEVSQNIFSSGIFADSDDNNMVGRVVRKKKRISDDSTDALLNDTSFAVNNKKRRNEMNGSILRKNSKVNSRPSFSIPLNKKSSKIEKNYNPMRLKDWIIKRRDGTKSIEIIGYPVSGKSGSPCSSGTVNARINAHTVKTSRGVVHLEGPMKMSSEIPLSMRIHFRNGFPIHWRKTISGIFDS